MPGFLFSLGLIPAENPPANSLPQAPGCGTVEANSHRIVQTTMSENTTPPRDSRPTPPRRRSRTQQISTIQIVFAAILSIGLLLVINFGGRIARGQQMDSERRRLQATIAVLETERVDLLKERDYAAHDASVEHWAQTEGKMVRDGEMLVIPIPAGVVEETPAPVAPAISATSEPEPDEPNWYLWWNLFLDGDPPF